MPESDWEDLALETLGELAWETTSGKELTAARGSYAELILKPHLQAAIERINPGLPPSAVADAVTLAMTAHSRDAYDENKRAHEYLVRGIRSVKYIDEFGAEQQPTIWLIDFRDPESNSFLAARQVTVKVGEYSRRFDIVLYVNGLPLAVVELKSASDEHATLQGAHAQIQNYVADLPLAFRHNVLCLISDGISARYGTPFTPFEHFAPWNVDETGEPVDITHPSDDSELALNVALYGLFEQNRFIKLLHGFINFTREGKGKRIAKPHQYFAVTKAVAKVIEASRSNGRAGVVWHTQGSGKSEEMVLASHLVAIDPALGNPTIVVITDRTDLDDQLYNTFLDSEILPDQPDQMLSREQLREELTNKRTGGILFTTLQKFGLTKAERKAGANHPLLSDRRNILVIVDEAHRSHYNNLDGCARHLREALPHATMLAFTGTPISKADRNTQEVFGDYIDVYDLLRAAEDGATVRVYHQSKVIDIDLPTGVSEKDLDDQAEEAVADLDESQRKRVQQRSMVIDTVYGAPKRVAELARDIVAHWEERSNLLRPLIGGSGKAMIVCRSREICVRVYDAIVALREGWHDPAVDKGKIKVVFTYEDRTDPRHFEPHGLRPSQRKVIQARAKDIDDELEILIVHSMLLTGYDSGPLHTMYMDRALQGADLMQALARVNRTFREKPAGLLVGYAPLTDKLRDALAEYTGRDQADQTLGRGIDRAIDELRNEHGNICEMLAGIDWCGLIESAKRQQNILRALLPVVNYLRDPRTPGNQVEPGEEDLATRFRRCSSRLEQFFALCSTSSEVNGLRDDVSFFVEVRRMMVKFDAQDREASGLPTPADVEMYLRNLTASAIEATGVTDLYAEAGMDLPDLSNLDAAYIKRLQDSTTPHLAVEALRRLIEQRMRQVTRHNVVRQQKFSEQLRDLMNRYTNQLLTSAQIIAELVAMAQDIAQDGNRGRQFDPELDDKELAFFDVVNENPSAVDVMGEDVLAQIARDLVATIQRSITTDWLVREAVRAKMRTTIKRLLAKYKYPPDQQPAAVELVLQQVETFAEDWVPPAP